MDWIMYTVGVVSHIWATLTIVGIITLFDTPQVKAGLRTVQLSGKIYIPWIGVLAFWMWYFFG
jgi:hypothetical protein